MAMDISVSLRQVANVISQGWQCAEERTRLLVGERYWSPAEEHITFLFSGELRASVETASQNRAFEKAFVSDLMSACPRLRSPIIAAAAGLVGSVNFHNRHHEAK